MKLIGHDAQFKNLINLADAGTLAHTMLFLGAEGIGKFRCASEFAAYLLGQNKTDFYLIEKLSDATSIKVDQIRSVVSELKYAPYQAGGVRVVLIRDAHLLGRSAANSLLKTLEEPPTGTYFILTTHAYAKMLPTILSRAHKFYFSPLSGEDVACVLSEIDPKLKYPATWLDLGSPGLILKWLANSDFLAHPLWRQFFGTDKLPDFASVMDFCQKFKKCGDVEAFFEWYLFNLRAQLLKHPTVDRMLLVDKSTEVMRNFAININPSLAMEHLLL